MIFKIITILIMSLTLVQCGGDFNVEYVNSVAVSHKVQQTTPNGVTVKSEKGESAEFLSQVDTGITTAFNNARLSGYISGYEYSSYNVYTPYKPCIPSPEQRIPSFQIEDGNYSVYNGSIYDQHNTKGLETDPVRISQGYKWRADSKTVLLAAEMVFTMEANKMEMIVCQGSEASNGANHGAEHYLIRINDYPYYTQTETHLVRVHPLLPKTESYRDFGEYPATGIVIGLVK